MRGAIPTPAIPTFHTVNKKEDLNGLPRIMEAVL